MIEITVNNTVLDLYPNTNLRVELQSPLFDEDTITNDKVLWFDIPLTQANQQAFDYANYKEVKAAKLSLRNYDITYRYANGHKYKGKLVIQTIDDRRVRAGIFLNGFLVDFKDTKLADLDLGSQILGLDAAGMANTVANTLNTSWPATNINFPSVKCLEFYGPFQDPGGNNEDWNGIINYYDTIAENVPYNVIDIEGEAINKYSIVPFLYLCYLLKKIFELGGLFATGSFFDDPDIQQIPVWNNTPLDNRPDKPLVVKATNTAENAMHSDEAKMLLFQDDSTGDNTDQYEVYDAGTSYFTITSAGQHFVSINLRLQSVVDSFTMHIAVKSSSTVLWTTAIVEVPIGAFDQTYTFDTDFWLDASYVGQTLRVEAFLEPGTPWLPGVPTDGDGPYISVTGDVLYANPSYDQLNKWNPTVEYKNHVPDMTVGEFLLAIKEWFNLAFFFQPDGKKVLIEFKEPYINKPGLINWSRFAINQPEKQIQNALKYIFGFDFIDDELTEDNFKSKTGYTLIGKYPIAADFPPATALKQMAISAETNKIYISYFVDPFGFNWTPYTDNYYDYEVGTGDRKDIRPSGSPLLTNTHIDANFHNNIMCEISQIANSVTFDQPDNTTGLKLFFYRGKQYNQGGLLYPMSTSQNRTFDGSLVGSLILTWDDPDYGLYVRYYRGWLTWLQSRDNCKINYLPSLEAVFGFDFTKKLRDEPTNYLVKKLTYIQSLNGIEQCEGDLIG